MFGIGSTELLVILVVALIVLGPKSLAKVTRTLGKVMGEFRRVSTDFQRTLNAEAAEDERRERREATAKAAREAKEAREARERTESSVDAARADNSSGPTAEAAHVVPHASAAAPGTDGSESTTAQSSAPPITPPSGSPLEAALAKTHAQAQAFQADLAPAHKDKGATA
ncbi:MAG: twin-arginine translocase subunit TatB [Desulfovibrio sp.]|nr:twin-arginine translocase subunit TatB [Desulfovibrio sp.]